MWKVSKLHHGTEPSREPIAADVHAAVLRWYTGHGSDADEAIGVNLVQQLRARHGWLACDCLGATVRPPLLTPAYMTEAGTYYFKRLTVAPRPAHTPTCPFHREQVIRSIGPRTDERPPRKEPDGFFAVLKPLRERLAQRPDEVDETVPSQPSIPRLARLLWQLTERAGTNRIAAIDERPRPSIKIEFDDLKHAAEDLFIAPGVPLAKLLFTHPSQLHSKLIYAQLRAAAIRWPSGSEPQAFLLTYATGIAGREIHFSTGDPVLVASPVKKLPSTDSVAGPYLVMVAIGHHAPVHGFAPVRAYAQPIYNGTSFVPVDTEAQRTLLRVLLQLQWTLRTEQISTRIKRPLFDLETELVACQPAYLLEGYHHRDDRRSLHYVELAGANEDRDTPTSARPPNIEVDGTIRVSETQLADPNKLLADFASRLGFVA